MSNNVQYILSLKDLFTRTIQDAKKATDDLDSSVNKTQSSLQGLGAAVGAYFAVSKIKDFVMGVVDVGAKLEATQIGLTTLLKDSDKAYQVIQRTKEDAMATPFGFDGLIQANKMLISAGVDANSARQDVLGLANAISATGGGDDELGRMAANLQGIKNLGKATAMDIKQFTYAGINIYGLLAEATGKSTEEVKDMEVSYDVLTSALKRAAKEGGIYANGLENMSKSTTVQISNLGDAYMSFQNDLFQAVKPAIDSVIASLKDMIIGLREGVKWLQENAIIVKSVALGFAVLTAGIVLNNTVVGLAAIRISGLTILQFASFVATNGLTGAWIALNAIMTANPIGLIIVGIAALTAGIYYAYQQSETFRGVLWGIWEVVTAVSTACFLLAKALVFPSMENIKNAFNGVKNLDISESYKKGVGLSAQKDYFDSKKKEDAKSLADAKDDAGFYGLQSGAKDKGISAPMAGTTTSASKVQSSSPKIFNITISKLNEKIEINTTKLEQSASKVEEIMTKILLSVVNDANRIANN